MRAGAVRDCEVPLVPATGCAVAVICGALALLTGILVVVGSCTFLEVLHLTAGAIKFGLLAMTSLALAFSAARDRFIL
jgi:hypothetical protein